MKYRTKLPVHMRTHTTIIPLYHDNDDDDRD